MFIWNSRVDCRVSLSHIKHRTSLVKLVYSYIAGRLFRHLQNDCMAGADLADMSELEITRAVL